MKIFTLFLTDRPHMSCEIFPPKEFAKIDQAKDVVRQLRDIRPAYISVTYGAAGKTPRFTQELSQYVQELGIPALSHLTCLNSPKEHVEKVLENLRDAHVENILALRGDLPEGGELPPEDHFAHASELIAAIKRRGSFCVGAACYPEGHPESPDRDTDLRYLREKQDAGADFLTSQMFFDNNAFYRFLCRAMQKGVRIPVTAGVMPVIRAKQIKRITSLSGMDLPPRFLAIIDRFGDKEESMEKAGVAYATEQIIDLIANGVNHVHLYTMNRPDIAAAIAHNLGSILQA